MKKKKPMNLPFLFENDFQKHTFDINKSKAVITFTEEKKRILKKTNAEDKEYIQFFLDKVMKKNIDKALEQENQNEINRLLGVLQSLYAK